MLLRNINECFSQKIMTVFYVFRTIFICSFSLVSILSTHLLYDIDLLSSVINSFVFVHDDVTLPHRPIRYA